MKSDLKRAANNLAKLSDDHFDKKTDKQKLLAWSKKVIDFAIENSPDMTDEESLFRYRELIKTLRLKSW